MEFDEIKFGRNKSIQKIIHFWIAKVVLCKGIAFVPTLCYILYKTELMSELSFYIMFRHSFIIKRLLFRTFKNFLYSWFEANNTSENKLFDIIKSIRLVDFETFCAK